MEQPKEFFVYSDEESVSDYRDVVHHVHRMKLELGMKRIYVSDSDFELEIKSEYNQEYDCDNNYIVVSYSVSVRNENYETEMEDYNIYLAQESDKEMRYQTEYYTKLITEAKNQKDKAEKKLIRLSKGIQEGKARSVEKQLNTINDTIKQANDSIVKYSRLLNKLNGGTK